MLKNLFTYQLAKELYTECARLKNPHHLQDQLNRAALSVALNLSEGYGKLTPKDRRRFYGIALGSLRETQCILDLIQEPTLIAKADHLGACLYKMIQKNSG